MNAELVEALADLSATVVDAQCKTQETLQVWRAGLAKGDVVRVGHANDHFLYSEYPRLMVDRVPSNSVDGGAILSVRPMNNCDGTHVTVHDAASIFPWFSCHEAVYVRERLRVDITALAQTATQEQLIAAAKALTEPEQAP